MKRKCLILTTIQLSQNKLKIGKMRNETDGVSIKKINGLMPKMYSFQVGDNNDHKKAKDVNKNVVATISHNKYKDVLLNNKCLLHSMNRIQSRNHRIGTYEISKLSLSNKEYSRLVS